MYFVEFQVFAVAPRQVYDEEKHKNACEDPMSGGNIFHGTA